MSQSPPPPPPPGGYGSPPPPPGGYGGYGGPPAGTPSYSVGDAAGYGWRKFQANAGQIVIAGIIALVAIAVFQLVAGVIRGVLLQDPECRSTATGFECTDGSGFLVTLLASAVSSFLFFVVYQVIGAGIIRGSLGITEGRPFRFDELFRTDKIGPVLVTSLISGAIIFVGTLLCFLPGIIASFLLSYALYFVIDQDMEPLQAIKASVDLVKDNVGTALLWAVVAFAITLLGFVACFVGAIVSIPVAFIGTAYTYKRLTGQEVVA